MNAFLDIWIPRLIAFAFGVLAHDVVMYWIGRAW